MLTLTLADDQGRYRVIAVDVTEALVRGATGDVLLDEIYFAVKELDAVKAQ
jgi:hypothetical protein